MNLSRTHDGEIIIGQWWRHKEYKEPRQVQRINTRLNEVVLQPENWLRFPSRVSTDNLRSEWECVVGVILKEYVQNGNRYAIQVFCLDRPHPNGHMRVIGELKL